MLDGWLLSAGGLTFPGAGVRRCTATSCPLHPYRMGKRPKSAKDRTPAQLEADRKNGERLRALIEKRRREAEGGTAS